MMGDNKYKHIDDDVAEVFIRMETQEATPDELRMLMAWAGDTPGKLDQFEELMKVWSLSGEVKLDKKRLFSSANEQTEAVRPKNNIKPWAIVVSAMAAAILMVFVGTFEFQNDNPRLFEEYYKTNTGELRDLALSDGSKVRMNGESSVLLGFEETSRYIKLEKGEAFFEVAHDPGRPFIVEVGGVLVRAVGTAFNIDHNSEGVMVTVMEGTVQVSLVSEGSQNKISLSDTVWKESGVMASRGEQVAVHMSNSEITNINNIQGNNVTANFVRTNIITPNQAVSWGGGILHLNGEILAVAVERINRQSHKKIAFADVNIANYPIYGSFRINDINSFINAIEVLYPIRHQETANGFILRRDTSG